MTEDAVGSLLILGEFEERLKERCRGEDKV